MKYVINDTTLTAIGDAVRGKAGTSELIPVSELADAITNLPSGGGSIDNSILNSVVDRSITEITANDLKGITKIGREAFAHCKNLTRLELPDSITEIDSYGISYTALDGLFIFPKNLLKLGDYVISQDVNSENRIYQVRFPGNNVVRPINSASESVFYNTSSISQVYEIQVPGELLDDYMNTSPWNGYYRNFVKPFTKYVEKTSDKIMLINQTITYTVELVNYKEAPVEYQIVSDSNAVNISNIVATRNAITFDISTNTIVGTANITVNVLGDNNHTFNRKITINVFEEIEESSYTVEAVDGAQYGFNALSDGYYVSTNQGVNSSYSLCKVNIHNPMNRIMYVDCINSGEANYDYGILSNVGQTLTLDNMTDDVTGDASIRVHTTFKGKSMTTVQTATYTDAYGDCSIYIKFRKDSSGNRDQDSLKFKIRFEEIEI